jgi:hypothetical protein
VKDVVGAEMLILPLVFSLGTIINTFFIWIFFQKQFGKITGILKKTFIDVSLASIVVGIVTYFFLAVFGSALNIRTFIGIFLQGFLSGIFGIAAGIAILRFLKNAELGEIVDSLRRKIWRKEVSLIAPEPEKLP